MMPDALRSWPVVFHGSRFDVRSGMHPGSNRPKDIVVHPGAVVILPLLDEQTVVLIRNQRIAAGGELWELPAGTLEPGEAPQVCAGRELIEETGYQAAAIEPLAKFYSSPGICTELMWIYLARGLQHVGQDLDEGERITPHPTPWKTTMQMMRTGQIQDGKTIATLLYYHAFHQRLTTNH